MKKSFRHMFFNMFWSVCLALLIVEIPSFFYRHYPQGTPENINDANVEWQWPMTAATGPLHDSIDYALTATDFNDVFSAYAYAHPQACTDWRTPAKTSSGKNVQQQCVLKFCLRNRFVRDSAQLPSEDFLKRLDSDLLHDANVPDLNKVGADGHQRQSLDLAAQNVLITSSTQYHSKPG